MTYFAPIITSAGLLVPSYQDIQNDLIDTYRTIYGASTYLGNDSADYQWISAVSLKLSDNFGLAQLVYNNRGPATAIGSALDGIVKINGIARLAATHSQAVLTLSGVPGTVVSSAVISDVNGILWNLPPTVIIGAGGTVGAVAICAQAGAISATAGTIIYPIGGFTAGWTGVTNAADATVGTVPETDSRLRARQAISVALPSETRLAGTQAEIEAVEGVTRVNVLENQTAVTDSYGNGGHSVTCVVEGGTDLDVATAIFNNRGIGANTLGGNPSATQVIVPVTDPNSGNITNIGIYRPTYVPIYVIYTIHPLTAAFNTAMQTAIIKATADYLNSLEIGESVTQSALYGVALSVMPDLTRPDFSIHIVNLGTTASPTGTTDITLTFYQVAQGSIANVSIVVV